LTALAVAGRDRLLEHLDRKPLLVSSQAHNHKLG
jgi:hypothetical protein